MDYPQNNRLKALQDLAMTPQEDALYQRHLQNLYGPSGVDNPDGSRSTLFQINEELGGRNYNLPTVYEGSILSRDDAINRAIQQGLGNFPSYDTPEKADARYIDEMHPYMEDDVRDYMKSKVRGPR